MIARQNQKARRARGFTIIEIMVVVVVLGVLAAVIIPNFVGRTDEAKVSTSRSHIAELSTLLESFRLDLGRYPDEAEGLDVLREPPNSEDADKWKGPYLRKAVPKDPWGNPYMYASPAPNGIDEYGIESFGADAAPGGDGFDRDINSWTNYTDEEEF